MDHDLYRTELSAALAIALVGLLATCGALAWTSIIPKPRPLSRPTRIDPNSASLADLTAIPGVGFPTAVTIVKGRPYSQLADLRPLLGEARVRAISPYLELK